MLYLIGNLVFYPIDRDNRPLKYIKGSINGRLYLNDIYTIDEILNNFPNVIECKDIHEVSHIYKTTP